MNRILAAVDTTFTIIGIICLIIVALVLVDMRQNQEAILDNQSQGRATYTSMLAHIDSHFQADHEPITAPTPTP